MWAGDGPLHPLPAATGTRFNAFWFRLNSFPFCMYGPMPRTDRSLELEAHRDYYGTRGWRRGNLPGNYKYGEGRGLSWLSVAQLLIAQASWPHGHITEHGRAWGCRTSREATGALIMAGGKPGRRGDKHVSREGCLNVSMSQCLNVSTSQRLISCKFVTTNLVKYYSMYTMCEVLSHAS